jgi:hypothetical protein
MAEDFMIISGSFSPVEMSTAVIIAMRSMEAGVDSVSSSTS